MTNKEWSEKILQSVDPSFKHRWEVYETYLRKYLEENTVWLDLGCGNNADVEEKNTFVSYAAGVDIFLSDHLLTGPFIIADILRLPFKTDSVDLISLRFVVEHISDPISLFNELSRVLHPNGTVILITTNLWSPIIFIPKILPYQLRKYMMKKLFHVCDEDVFPTYHKFNSYAKVKSRRNNFHILKSEFIQDLGYTNKMIFIIFLIWHLITKINFLKIFRSNLLVIYKKII